MPSASGLDVHRPRFPSPGRFWLGWGLAGGVTSLLVLLIVAPPFVGEALRHSIMAGFSTACHQLADRSPALGGVQLAVCHRCLGIYAALPLGSMAFLGLKRWDGWAGREAPWLLLFALAVPGFDWLAGAAGVWANTPVSRVATGAVFGVVAGYFLARACTGYADRRASPVVVEAGAPPRG